MSGRRVLIFSFLAARPSWRAVLATEAPILPELPGSCRVELHDASGLRSAATSTYQDQAVAAALQGADFEPDWTDCECDAAAGVDRTQELHDSECPLHGWFEGGEADG